MTGAWVVLAGGLGALARFVLDGELRHRRPMTFPWPTIVINVSGSLALGVLTGLVLFHGGSTDTRLIAGTGFCGGYTTFSTASVETVRLLQQQRLLAAAGNALGTLAMTVAAAALGLVLARL